MNDLERSVERIALETTFSGVVRVDRGGEVEFVEAYGLAHRGWDIPNTIDTRFGIASGTKGLTALTVMSLIEEVGWSSARPPARCSGTICRSSTTR
jgi:CubicO group peptidase (beta-lactamase class C family)